MKFVLLLILISALDVAAIVIARYYIEKRKGWMMAASMLFFAASAYIYVQLMEFSVTAVINVLSAASSTLFVTLFYFIVFKERITRGQWMGIAIAIIGISLLEI